MKDRTRPSLLALGLMASLTASAAGVRSPGMLANTCAGCHGTLGASAGEQMPSIAGMDNGYLFSVLSDYKTGLRRSTIMGRLMKGYSDQEIWAIAAFFAEQPWVSTDRVARADQIRVGREIHERQCESCHEDAGRAQDDDSPRMAGQWSGYLNYALETCRDIGRRCHPNKMGERVMALSDQEIEALARFYESEK
ncbi:c-type cytochrome [Thiocystis violacea]|uniref:c-type cytochrome n=1 Tax=Thiocystis violacea TaxID=13725 RepID=UPI00190876EA|nr:c-type cytochrome [Thiocystis violacea]MBK1724079.1 cytochrome C [Thiocystis violacea]